MVLYMIFCIIILKITIASAIVKIVLQRNICAIGDLHHKNIYFNLLMICHILYFAKHIH